MGEAASNQIAQLVQSSEPLDANINRSYGETISNVGAQTGQVFASFANDAAITAIQVTTQIENVRVAGCQGTSAPAYADANIFGAYFNAAVPTPGSHVNDVTASIRVSRISNSSDAAGILRIAAGLTLCQNANCSIAAGLGTAQLGTVARDVPVRLKVEWQPENDRFAFQRNNAPEVFVTYSVPDAAAPGNPHKLLGTLAQVPNCISGQRPVGFIAASFDDVFVNATAVP